MPRLVKDDNKDPKNKETNKNEKIKTNGKTEEKKLKEVISLYSQ